MSTQINDDKIPNNVDLSSDRKLQRALEAWQPRFLDWWKEMGPVGFQSAQVYLRTAVSVGASGWAHFDEVPREKLVELGKTIAKSGMVQCPTLVVQAGISRLVRITASYLPWK